MERTEFNPHIPARLANALAPFTPYASGWCRWYAGKMRHVCGRKTPLEHIEDCWIKVKGRIDQEQLGAVVVPAEPTILFAAGKFYEYLDQRVQTGKPKPLSKYTAKDYRREINAFGRHAGPNRTLRGLLNDPEVFTSYAKQYNDNAPETLRRVVAYVQAFFSFCRDERLISQVPQYGRYFVKPPAQDRRDKRLSEEKSYSPAELRLLLEHSTVEERAWLALGLNGALDNADIANLTRELIDSKNKLLDYRRRKEGKVRRVIPILPQAWQWLQAYVRPEPADPAYADHVFLTPTGLPLQRLTDRGNIDYLAMMWNRLMIRAGLKPPMPRRSRRREDQDEPQPPRKVKAKGSAGGRGFRSLRTTFPNLAPPGYRDEIEIIMGHSAGTVLADNYIERCGTDRLRALVKAVWRSALTSPLPRGGSARHKGETAHDASRRATQEKDAAAQAA